MRALLALVMVLLPVLARGAEKFQVLYPADIKYASDPGWLKQIKTWGATGITLRVHRSMTESRYHQYDWAQVERAIAAIDAAGLDVNIRVSTVFINGSYVDRYSNDDFHQTKGGEIYYNNNADRPLPMLNYTSDRAFGDLVRYYTELASAVRRMPGGRRVRFFLMALNANDETEFPVARFGPPGWGWLSGYSRPEQEAFMRFLKLRYNGNTENSDAGRLDSVWKATFRSINTREIRIDDYDWERLRDTYKFYPAGRKDFLDFRASQLKRFIDTCARIVERQGYRIGVQFGSIYDEGLEFRSSYDVTPLVERAGLVIVGDVAENGPNFSFVADYLRSLGRYWDWRKNRSAGQRTIWGTETNWPGYNHIEPRVLVRQWTEQVDSASDRGASVLAVYNWGTEGDSQTWETNQGPRTFSIAGLVIKDSLDKRDFGLENTAYAEWRSEVNRLRNKPVKTVNRTTAVHLSCEQILFSRESAGEMSHHRNNRIEHGTLPTISGKGGGIPIATFPLRKFAGMRSPYGSSSHAYDGNCDLVTNYMIANSPSYLSTYKHFYLTGTSYYMPDTVYEILTRRAAAVKSTRSAQSLSSSQTASVGSGAASNGPVRVNARGEIRPAAELEQQVKQNPDLSPQGK